MDHPWAGTQMDLSIPEVKKIELVGYQREQHEKLYPLLQRNKYYYDQISKDNKKITNRTVSLEDSAKEYKGNTDVRIARKLYNVTSQIDFYSGYGKDDASKVINQSNKRKDKDAYFKARS